MPDDRRAAAEHARSTATAPGPAVHLSHLRPNNLLVLFPPCVAAKSINIKHLCASHASARQVHVSGERQDEQTDKQMDIAHRVKPPLAL